MNLRNFNPTHRQVNDWLTAVVVGLGLYIAIMPWLPNLGLWIDQMFDGNSGHVYRGNLSAGQAEDGRLAEAPKDNRLVIPVISLDEPIIEGSDLSVINDGGAWRRPNTSTPDTGGNTVLVGHRFSYWNPATFYHLDKIDVGERFAVWWQEKEYIYEVFETTVVGAHTLSIEDSSAQPMMTLYTCTPIWTATDRLVVKARLISPSEVF